MTTTILVPTDLSDASAKGVDYAAQLARDLGARLTVLVVIEPIQYVVPPDLSGVISNIGTLLPEQQKIAREELAKLATRLHRRHLKVQTTVVRGVPHQCIVEAAKKCRADLIVMATHGRTGLSHFLLGSVAEKVLRTATCPVLMVRSFAPPAKRKPTRRKSRRRRSSATANPAN